MAPPRTIVTRALTATLLAGASLALTGCEEGFEPPADTEATYTSIDVALIANGAANVDRFDLSTRTVGAPTWNTQSLTPTLNGTIAEAGSLMSMLAGEYVFRAEAFDASGRLLGQPREVRVSVVNGVPQTIEIALDLSEFGEGEDGATVATLIAAQNGANLDQSTLSNLNPTDTVAATIDVVSTSDAEGDPITVGFVSEYGNASGSFFDTSGPSTSFTILPPPEIRSVYAIAVDDSGAGTAHQYSFDASLTPSSTGMTVWRVNDMAAVNGGNVNVMVLSGDGAGLLAWADWNGDGNPDFGFDDASSTLLSWGIDASDPALYRLRWQEPSGAVIVGTLDMFNGVVSSAAE